MLNADKESAGLKFQALDSTFRFTSLVFTTTAPHDYELS